MLPFHHDSTALRAVLTADFCAISRDVVLAEQTEQVAQLLIDCTLHIMSELLGAWNYKNPVSRLPAEILASCFMFLPFRDRIAASHVSRYWRHASLHHPAVWSHIELSTRSHSPLALFATLLARTGQHPIDLTYVHQETRDPTYWTSFLVNDKTSSALLEMIESIAPRVRMLDWDAPTPLILENPMPQLEALKSNHVWISDAFMLQGHLAHLRALHIPLHSLPHSTLALPSVRELTAIINDDCPSWQAHMPNLFNVFPQVESLSLRGHSADMVHLMPPGPLPPSLTRLALAAVDADGEDLVENYGHWRSAQLRTVELRFIDWFTADSGRRGERAAFFTGVLELSIGPDDEDGVCIFFKYADGLNLTLAFDRALSRANYGTSAMGSLKSALRWLAASNAHTMLRSIRLSPPFFTSVVESGIQFPAVRTAVVALQILYRGTHHAAEFARPGGLSFIDHIHICFPNLDTFVVELQSADGIKIGHVSEAVKLLRALEKHGAPDLPVLHIRGFSREVALAIDPLQFRQLSMRVEFDIPLQD